MSKLIVKRSIAYDEARRGEIPYVQDNDNVQWSSFSASANNDSHHSRDQPVEKRHYLHRVFQAVTHGIPIELTDVVSPRVGSEILNQFREWHRENTNAPIKRQVNHMLGLIETRFPHLDVSSIAGRGVWAYFFGAVGLYRCE